MVLFLNGNLRLIKRESYQISWYFGLNMLFYISSWKDLAPHNVYKLFDCTTKISIRRRLFFVILEINLHGYANKQNCRIWIEDQPEEVQELPLNPEKNNCLTFFYIIGQIPVEILGRVIEILKFRIVHVIMLTTVTTNI